MEPVHEEEMEYGLATVERIAQGCSRGNLLPPHPYTNEELEYWGRDFIKTRNIPSDMKFGEYIRGARAVCQHNPLVTNFDRQLVAHVQTVSGLFLDLQEAA